MKLDYWPDRLVVRQQSPKLKTRVRFSLRPRSVSIMVNAARCRRDDYSFESSTDLCRKPS